MITAESGSLPPLSTVNLTCKEDFFEQNFTCLPRCDVWDERPQRFATIDDVLRIGFVVSRWLVSALFLLAFALRRKTL